MSRKKSDLSNSLNFVPSVKKKESEIAGFKKSHCHFEHAKQCARMREQRSKELEVNMRRVELEQVQLREIQCTIAHDH